MPILLYVSKLRSDVGQCLRNVFMFSDFGLTSGGARGLFICLCYVIIYVYLLICYVYLLICYMYTELCSMSGGAR